MQFRRLFRFRHFHGRRFVILVGVGGVIEEGVELVILLGRERIVFVVVALAAAEGGAHPDRHGGVDAIDDRLVAELLIVGAAFGVGHGVAMETGGDFLLQRRVREHVAGDLLDGESIERQVAVERIDHPIAIRPHAAAIVLFVALGVRVAREVEP